MFPPSTATRSAPSRLDCENARQWIERALLCVNGAVGRLPPIAMEKTRHDAVATAAMPNEHTAGTKGPGELPNHAAIIGWIGEEPERGKQIQHGVKPIRPAAGQPAHVPKVISQTG